MGPKFIIVKMHSKKFCDELVRRLTMYPRVKFWARKINGCYTVAIKCELFYCDLLSVDCNKNIYKSYIYLYTSLSLILAELIIDFYELKLTHQILCSEHKELSPYSMFKLKNILNFVLDSNFPSNESKKLYLYRKDLILTKLLINFRKCNYIYPEHFVYFKLDNYLEHLENIVDKTCAKY